MLSILEERDFWASSIWANMPVRWSVEVELLCVLRGGSSSSVPGSWERSQTKKEMWILHDFHRAQKKKKKKPEGGFNQPQSFVSGSGRRCVRGALFPRRAYSFLVLRNYNVGDGT
jgi:hypothetical protein